MPGAGESEGIRESWLKGVGFLFGLTNFLKLIVVIDVNILCEYTKSHWILHFKWVNYMVSPKAVKKEIFGWGRK